MKKLLLLTLTTLLASCSSIPGQIDVVSHTKSYGHQVQKDIVRKGDIAQRFEIRHGDCGGDHKYDDCTNDRRRVEISNFNVPITSTTWFGWSMYLPKDFQTLGRTNTTLGQVKTLKVRKPILGVLAREGVLMVSYDIAEDVCRVVDDIDTLKGKWTDIMIKLNFDTTHTKDKIYSEVYINNEKVCEMLDPIIDRGTSDVYYRYGIYNSYVSRWLDDNKTKNVNLETFNDEHTGEGLTIVSPTNLPWDVDWGVKLPTQVVYYDEIRIGSSRESVDINMNDDAVD